MPPRKKTQETAPVGILMGSDFDLPVMEECSALLRGFGVAYEMHVMSAHRTPDRVARFARDAEGRGIRVLIAGAGAAAHLAGVVAAHTTLPVIGVPLEGSPLHGLDALLATVQMPGGIPVATVAIGKAGARNAGLLAVQILALGEPRLRRALQTHRERMAGDVATKDRQLQAKRP
jgi:phosphoribosylaminoimidazole carboxylase PurE protein